MSAMAEAGSRKTTRRRDLECPVCLLRVNHSNHRALACQHVFCEKCLAPVVKDQAIICQFCKKKTSLESEKVSDLPRSVVLMRILNTLCEKCLSTDREICCDYCGKWSCTDCHRQCQLRDELNTKAKDVLAEWPEQERRLHEEKVKLAAHMTSLSEQVDQTLANVMRSLQLRSKELKDEIQEIKRERMQTINNLSKTISDEKRKINASIDESNDEDNKLDEDTVHTMGDRWRDSLRQTTDTLQTHYTLPSHITDTDMIQNVPLALGRLSVVDYQSAQITHHTFGSRGAASGQFNGPSYVAQSPVTGHTVVTDVKNNRLQLFDKDNQVVSIIGSEGKGPGQFDFGGFGDSGGVGFTREGHLVVADSKNNRLQIVTERGVNIRCIGCEGKGRGEFRAPKGLSVHKDCIYTCDLLNDRIQVLRLDGTFIRNIGSCDLFSPGLVRDVAVCQNGDVVVAVFKAESNEGSKLVVFTESGQHKATWTRLDQTVRLQKPSGVTVTGDGKIIVTDWITHQVHVLSQDGKLLRSIGSRGNKPGEFNGPRGVVCTREGGIMVVDQGNDRVQLFNFE